MEDLDGAVKRKLRLLCELSRRGVPNPIRGMVWQYMTRAVDDLPMLRRQYQQLIDRPSPFDAMIRRDIMRTFPSNEFFAEAGGIGQESMFNVLKAYSLYDTEVGYCQARAGVARAAASRAV